MDADRFTDEQLAARARIDALARIAYGRAMIASGEEILKLIALLTGKPEPASRPSVPECDG